MKKYILLTFAAMFLLMGSRLAAQNCEALVLPHVGNNADMLDKMPQGKFAWYCAFSQNSFYFADQLPEGVVAHNLAEVRNTSTGEYLPTDFVVDLNEFSYYAYNFIDFQIVETPNDVYFTLVGAEHRYLVVRNRNETKRITDQSLDIYSFGDITHGEYIITENR